MIRILTVAFSWEKSFNPNLFYNKVLNSSLNTHFQVSLKVKNRKAVWVQNGTLVVDPHHPMAAWELWFAATAQHQERISYCIASLGKDQIPKFKVKVSTECILLVHQSKVQRQ